MSAARNQAAGPNVEAMKDLRATIDWMRADGVLLESDVEIDPDLEITGVQKNLDGGGPMLFNNVKGKPDNRVVTNLFSDMATLNRLFGWEDARDRTLKIVDALRNPVPPVVVSQDEAPVQEEVIENPNDCNDYTVAIRHTEYEPELTVGSGIRLLTGEQFEGGTDVGYNRCNFRWGNVGTFQISPGSHAWQTMMKYYKADQRIPLTLNFGLPMAPNLLAGAGFDYAILPQGCDELGVAGALQGGPVRMCKARTVDAMSLADCEVVFEGYLDPHDRRYETKEAEDAGVQGRFHFHPEWAGYMGKAYKAPAFHVTAVTQRQRASKPIIFPLGVHTLDCVTIETKVREACIYELCERIQPGIIQDVHIPYPMTDWGGCMIQVQKRNQIDEGWQRNFLAAILACSQGMRLAIAVSEDTDMYSMNDIIWNLTTRVNPHTDILNPLPGGRGQTFMPAERMTAGAKEWTASNTNFEGGMGIDCTVPYGYESDFMRPVYPVDKVNPDKFFSDEKLQEAYARMLPKGWVKSLARTGR